MRSSAEEAAASEPLYRALAAKLPGGAAFVVDRELRYLLAEGDALRAVGLSPADFEGRTLRQALPPEVASSHEPRYRRALAGHAFRHEHDSHGRHFVSHGVPLRSPDGDVYAALVISYDITDRKISEREAREGEERLAFALQAARIVAWNWNLEDDQAVRSDGGPNVLGLRTQTATELFELIVPEDRERVRTALDRAKHGDGRYDVEFRVVTPDGRKLWLASKARLRRDDATGAPHLTGVTIDVTARRTAEEQLRRSEQLVRTIAENSTQALFMMDERGVATYMNPAAEKVTGFRFADLGGRPLHDHVHHRGADGGCPLDACPLGATYRDKVPVKEREDVFVRSDGSSFPVVFSMVPILNDHELVGAVLEFRDISDEVTRREEQQRMQEALREADRRKDEFIATLAHELRDPLAPIRTGLDVLKRAGGNPAAAARTIDVMDRQVTHMVRLIDDLLDVARITSGKIQLRQDRVQVRAVVEHAIETCRPAIEAAEHALTIDLPDAPAWIVGDELRLAQVLSNLIKNAVKYTPRRGAITVAAAVDDGHAVIRVSDNGTGIASDMLPRVFDMFAQVGRTLDRSQGGLGIGLALSRRLVEMQGGIIAADSRGPGEGSTFTVRLPLAPPT